MIAINIIVLLIAAIITCIQVFREYKKNQAIGLLRILLVLIIFGLGLSITDVFIKKTGELEDAKIRETEHIELITRADLTLNNVESLLDTLNLVLGNTDTSLSRLSNLQSSAQNLTDSLSTELIIQRQTNYTTQDLLLKTEKTVKLQSQSVNELTGGNSFCYIMVTIMPYYIKGQPSISWVETIVLRNDGEYSLRNVHIEVEKPYIAFQNNRNNIPNDSWVVPPLKDEYFVGRRSMYVIYQGQLPDSVLQKDQIIYNIDFFLGNGNKYTQVIKLAKAHGGWPLATKIIETTDSIYRYEYVHPGYPQKPVDWKTLRPLKNAFRK